MNVLGEKSGDGGDQPLATQAAGRVQTTSAVQHGTTPGTSPGITPVSTPGSCCF